MENVREIVRSEPSRAIWKYAGAVSVRVKVLGIVVGVILLLGGFVIFQMQAVLRDKLSQNLEEQGIAIAGSITRDLGAAVQFQDREAVAAIIAERAAHFSSQSHNTAVDYMVVTNGDNTIFASVGTLPDLLDFPAPRSEHGDYHPVLALEDHNTIEFQRLIPETDSVLRLGLSLSVVDSTVSDVTIQLIAITLVMVAVGFAAAFFLTWILTRPILELVDATHAIAGGDFSRRVPRWADDEIGDLASAFNQMAESLQRADRERFERERLRAEYITGVIIAQENERQRIARELHDSTSQSLTSLLVGLQNLRHAGDDIDTQVDELRTVVGGVLEEIRGMAWRLRPSALDDLGLESALKNYINDYQKRHNIPVEIVIRGLDSRLAPEIETTIYRIVQEGLTNIARYAQASAVSLVITRKNGKVKIIIEDDGIGFDPVAVGQNKNSLGLRGMRERAGLFGGSMTIESQPGQGTSIFVEIQAGLPEEN